MRNNWCLKWSYFRARKLIFLTKPHTFLPSWEALRVCLFKFFSPSDDGKAKKINTKELQRKEQQKKLFSRSRFPSRIEPWPQEFQVQRDYMCDAYTMSIIFEMLIYFAPNQKLSKIEPSSERNLLKLCQIKDKYKMKGWQSRVPKKRK